MNKRTLLFCHCDVLLRAILPNTLHMSAHVSFPNHITFIVFLLDWMTKEEHPLAPRRASYVTVFVF